MTLLQGLSDQQRAFRRLAPQEIAQKLDRLEAAAGGLNQLERLGQRAVRHGLPALPAGVFHGVEAASAAFTPRQCNPVANWAVSGRNAASGADTGVGATAPDCTGAGVSGVDSASAAAELGGASSGACDSSSAGAAAGDSAATACAAAGSSGSAAPSSGLLSISCA